MPTDADKRDLQFDSIDDMMRDVDQLISRGYEPKGNWNLTQVCGHITEWMRFPMDGFPQVPFLLRPIFWVICKTVAPGMKRKILENGFRAGMMTDPKTVPAAAEVSDEEAARNLRDTAIRLSHFEGELHPSPLFGAMDREMALHVGLMHAAHHLAFLHPK